MKVLRIFGIVAAVHALAFLVIMANPGCSTKPKAAPPPIASATDDSSSTPSISVPSGGASSGDASPIAAAPMSSGSQGLGFDPNAPANVTGAPLYSPTRPGSAAAAALQPAAPDEVTPATTVTVGRGDSLWTIAHKNKVSVAELAAANHLKSGAMLHIGQKLLVPTKATGAASPKASAEAPVDLSAPKATAAKVSHSSASVKHVVKAGETLGSIAHKYGVKAGDIAVANNISNPAMIRVGRELIIPGWHAPKATQSHAKSSKATLSEQPVPQPDDQASAPSSPAASDSSQSMAPVMPTIGLPGPDQDLDAGLKKQPAGQDSSVPVINVNDGSSSSDSSGSAQPAPSSAGTPSDQSKN